MTQADSVHSTPPINTSAINLIDPSRRGFLVRAAAVAAGSAAVGMALPPPQSANASQGVPDPIFAAIEAHKAARAVVYSACDDISAAEQEIGRGKVSEARKSGNAVRLEQCEAAMSAAHDAEDVAACAFWLRFTPRRSQAFSRCWNTPPLPIQTVKAGRLIFVSRTTTTAPEPGLGSSS